MTRQFHQLLPGCLTRCRRLATSTRVIALSGALVLGPSVWTTAAAVPGPTDPPTDSAPDKTPTLPSPAQSYALFRSVEHRVRGWDRSPFESASPIAAARVVLAQRGEVLGTGVDDSGDRLAVSRALARAMRRAEARIGLPRDALLDESMRSIASDLTIWLELAGPAVPFAPDALADASLLISPGVEGVGVRLGDRHAVMFPGRMLETGTLPAAALRALVARVTDDPALALLDPATLQAEHGLTLERFAVRQIAQARPGAPASLLVRGGTLVERSAITTRSIRQLADDLARYLMGRTIDQPVGADLLGTDQPRLARAGQTRASVLEQALAAIALARYASAPGVDPAQATRAYQTATALVESLAQRATLDASLAGDPASAAMVSCAITLITRDDPKAFADHAGLVDRLDRLAWATLTLTLDRPGQAPDVALAPAAYALSLRVDSLDAARRDRVEVLVRAIYRATPRGLLVSQMPWLGWAELELARGDSRVPAAAALRAMRDQIAQHTLTAADAGTDARDLVGGIVFTASRTPLPTWQGVRPLAFLASMLGDDRLTPDAEVARMIGQQTTAMRFLTQLQLDPCEASTLAGGARGLGGITAASWDRTQPPEASAMTLLTASQTLASLERIGARKRGGPAAQSP